MAVLYIDRKDLEIRAEGNRLCLYENGELRSTVPLNLLERVVIRAGAKLDAGVLATLADRDVGVLALGGRGGQKAALLLGSPRGDAARRIAQYRWHHDAAYRRVWSLALVRLKLLSQKRLLLRALRQRPDRRAALSEGADKIEGMLASLPSYAQTADAEKSLRGVEGAAASAYFRAFAQLFPPSLEFAGRNRRPPQDPVNAALSLGYTLLFGEAANACHMAGLDPCVGFFHEPAHNRESLAADLIEPTRAKVDEWVWRLFAERTLRADAFVRQEDACLLGKAGRQTFYAAYEVFARPLRRLLRRQAAAVARRLTDEARAR